MDFNGFCAAVATEFGLTDTPSVERSRELYDKTRGIRLFIGSEYFDGGKYAGKERVYIIANSIFGPRTKTQYYTRIPLSEMVDLPKNVKDAIGRLVQMEILAEKKLHSRIKTMKEQEQFIELRDAMLADPSTTMEQVVELMVKEADVCHNLETNLYLSKFRNLLQIKRKEQEK